MNIEQKLRELVTPLECGEYDGADIMRSYCAMKEAADRIEHLQAEREKLRALLLQSAPIIHAHAGASHMLEGFKPKRNKWDALVEQIDAAIAKATGEKDE